MNNRFRSLKIIVVFVLALVLVLLSACARVKLGSSDTKDIFLSIDNASCTKAEAVYLLMEEKALYETGETSDNIWSRPVGSVTMEEYAKEVAEDKLTRYASAQVMSDRIAAYPSEEAKNLAGEEAVASWAKISSLYDVDAYGITASDVNELYYKKAVYEAVYDKITRDAIADITEDSTRVMLADYVVIPQKTGENTATTILESVREGTEFSQAAAIAGYTVLTNQKIKRGELNPTVDTIAFALVDGEWSEVIESKDGYYIIHCLDDDLVADSAANYNEILNTTKENAFNEAFYEFSTTAERWIDSKFWEEMDIGSIQ